MLRDKKLYKEPLPDEIVKPRKMSGMEIKDEFLNRKVLQLKIGENVGIISSQTYSRRRRRMVSDRLRTHVTPRLAHELRNPITP